MSFHVLSCPFISFHVLSCPFISFHVLSFPFISLLFLSFPFMSFHFLSFPFMSFHFLSCAFISFHFRSFPSISFHFLSLCFYFHSFSFHVLSFPFMFLSFSFHVPFMFLSCSFHFLSFPFIFLSFSLHFLPRNIACRERCPERCFSIPRAIPQTSKNEQVPTKLNRSQETTLTRRYLALKHLLPNAKEKTAKTSETFAEGEGRGSCSQECFASKTTKFIIVCIKFQLFVKRQ